jgi:hypothetical protein
VRAARASGPRSRCFRYAAMALTCDVGVGCVTGLPRRLLDEPSGLLVQIEGRTTGLMARSSVTRFVSPSVRTRMSIPSGLTSTRSTSSCTMRAAALGCQAPEPGPDHFEKRVGLRQAAVVGNKCWRRLGGGLARERFGGPQRRLAHAH